MPSVVSALGYMFAKQIAGQVHWVWLLFNGFVYSTCLFIQWVCLFNGFVYCALGLFIQLYAAVNVRKV